MTHKATFYLLTGPIGAGKTTHGMKLAWRYGCVRFSIDEWMSNLFAADMPQPLDVAWMWQRVSRCEAQIMATALQVAGLGGKVALDIGLTTREHRQRTTDTIRGAGHDIELHWLDVPAVERWRRVNARNDERGDTFALTVTRQMFDFMEARYETPDAGELSAMNGLRLDGTHPLIS